MKKQAPTDRSPTAVGQILSFRCPTCAQKARLHAESVHPGAEILCSECTAILRIDTTDPLTLREVEEEDLSDD